MRIGRCCAVVLALWLSGVASAQAAFPGGNGLLAVGPLKGLSGAFLVEAGGSGLEDVCDGCRRAVTPRWSPDGHELVFSGGRDGWVSVVTPSGRCVRCDLPGSGGASSPSFTADGTAVTFVTRRGALRTEPVRGRGRVATVTGPFTAAVRSATGMLAVAQRSDLLVGFGGALRVLTHGGEPAWSPSGRTLAFVRAGWIWTISLRARHVLRLVRGVAPAFSPDGRSIAFIGVRHRVMVVPVRGGASRPLAAVHGYSVDWQPTHRFVGKCPIPIGARIEKPDPAVAPYAQGIVVFTVSGQDDDSEYDEAYACLPSIGRVADVGGDYSDDEGGGSGGTELNQVVGDYASFDTNYSNRYDGDTQGLTVANLRTATVVSPAVGCGYLCELYGTALNSSGTIAWYTTTETETNEPSGIDLSGIACPTVSLCIAADSIGNLFTSTDPADDASAWNTSYVGDVPILGVACVSADLCLALDQVGIIHVSTDPSDPTPSWTPIAADAGHFPTAVSCAGDGLCAVVDDVGDVATSSAAGTAGSWTRGVIDPGHRLVGVSCPSSQLCVTIDDAGQVLSSTDPADSRSWKVVSLRGLPGEGTLALWAVGCLNASVCTVLGTRLTGHGASRMQSARALTTTDPTGAASGWLVTNEPAQVIGTPGISCPSASECFVVEAGGAIGSGPPTGPWSTTQTVDTACDMGCVFDTISAANGSNEHTIANTVTTQLTDPTWTGDTLTWTDDGQPRSAVVGGG